MTQSKIRKTFQNNVKKKRTAAIVAAIGLALGVSVIPGTAAADESHLTYIEELGKRLFFENISDPKRMSCSTCHAPTAGGVVGISGVNMKKVAMTGANPHTEGNLRPPTNKYVQFIDLTGEVRGLPNFGSCSSFPSFTCGGTFWDGRAKGGTLVSENNPFAGLDEDEVEEYSLMYSKYDGAMTAQAHASPFINPVEQGHANKTAVCQQVAKTKWGPELYKYTWSVELNCNENIDRVFARFALALGAWQMSYENNPFDSKRDIALANDDDGQFPLKGFTKQENLGHDLFFGVAEDRSDLLFGQGRCRFCHESGDSLLGGSDEFERYTDDSYHNIGVPRNYEIPDQPEPSIGLAGTTMGEDNVVDPNHIGLNKTPTLRNLDLRPGKGFVKAYSHNGWFKSLESIVHFYNSGFVSDDPERGLTAKSFGITRCEDKGLTEATEKEALANNCWPASEFQDTSVIGGFMGDLRMTSEDEAAIVAYLKTLTDTSVVKQPHPYKSAPYDESRLKR